MWSLRGLAGLTGSLATLLVALTAAAAMLVLLLILGHVLVQGLPALSLAFFSERPLPPGQVGGGVAPAILGSLEMLAVAGVVGIPLGIGTAIYLSEFGSGQLARTVSFTIDLIAGLPSIVVGVFVWPGWCATWSASTTGSRAASRWASSWSRSSPARSKKRCG
jgi:phosphate transport system permease protein